MGLVRGQGRTGSKCTQDGVTVLLELCVRVEQLDGVDGSRDRIAPRDPPEAPRVNFRLKHHDQGQMVAGPPAVNGVELVVEPVLLLMVSSLS